MQKSWLTYGILAVSMVLAGCYGPVGIDESKPTPCIIPNNLTNDAMGQLGIRIIHIGDTVRIILPSDNIFTLQSGQIKESAYPGLDLLAKRIKDYYGYIPMTISGYTDDLTLPNENKWIGEQQARSIETFLWTRGYCHHDITTVGAGENDADTVASNRSVLGSAANRRVEITLRAHTHYGP